MASVFRRNYTKTMKDGRKVEKTLRKWYVEYVDAGTGKPVRVPGYVDKKASEQLGARLERESAQRKEGLIGPENGHAKRPALEHLEDYRRYLVASNRDAEYVQHAHSQVNAVLTGCGFTLLADIEGPDVVEFLADLRADRPVEPVGDGKEWLAAKEVAAVMGILLDSVHRVVKRGQLACEGAGREKKFRPADVEALLRERRRGIGPSTSNHYLVAAKSFAEWLRKNDRLTRNPLEHLAALNIEVDLRRPRRPLPAAEFDALVTAARAGRPFRGLAGEDRATLYTFAANTGLRASELGSLEPASFLLDEETPVVRVRACYSKHREEDLQPMRPDLAALMRRYVGGRPAGVPLWPGTWTVAGAEMVRLDLAAAGIPYETPDGFFDFHALRHHFVTLLVIGKASSKDAQVLARHKTHSLTMDRYAHNPVKLAASALGLLPQLADAAPQPDAPAAPAVAREGVAS
jgi:integrase